ncbi:MAG TPA: methyltransferase domain-containing protein [Thermoanaerobaculia bacterium]|nr:methyltransferase domain-containing protein [Thermoanaerobaculia bacterium]
MLTSRAVPAPGDDGGAFSPTQIVRRLHYLAQRVGRNLLPGWAARLGKRLLGVSAGAETTEPDEIAAYYRDELAAKLGRSLEGQRVLLFGGGGHFGVACRLLRMGAGHVYLYDKYATPDDAHNARLLPEFAQYLRWEGGRVVPDGSHLTHLPPGDEIPRFPAVDLVLSVTVLEHVDDLDGWLGALAATTEADGAHLHHVDLRDHFFATPFEMLCYRESTWRRWLDPRRSHLNRLRLPDYEALFRRHFEEVAIEVLERDEAAFATARPRIRPEFLTGDPAVDAVTAIQVRATRPRGG